MANVHQGLKKILFKRLFFITLWHVGIQTLILQFIASIDLYEESSHWTVKWFKNVLKPQNLIVILFQFFLSMTFIVTESSQYLKIHPCDGLSRFGYICQKFSLNNLLWFFLYLVRGILSFIVFFITLRNYFISSTEQLNSKTANNQYTETIIILINNAIWINIIFFLYDFIYQKNFRYFSLIQHNQSIIMPTIIVAIKDVSIKSFYYCFIFIIFYFFRGLSFCTFICYLFSLKCNISYTTIFSPFILYYLWLLNAFILFSNSTLKLLFDIFLISKIDFPITADSNSKQSNEYTLKDALSTCNVPLLQYLGYYDFNIVSQFDSSRRKQIFSLSYPGGHPYIWKELSNEAIKLIVDTTSSLERITSQKKTPVENTRINRSLLTVEQYYSKMRPLSPSQYSRHLDTQFETNFDESVITKISDFMKTLRPVAYLTESMTEKQLESALQHYQALSLACYSLANLAAASRTEDKFGIIQQDLSTMIHVLLKLHVTLNKLVVIVNKKQNSSLLQVKKALVSVAKSSLYKLAIEFGSYVKDLSLSPEDQKLFSNFIHFKN